jgi:hypothetical protein
LSFCQQLIDNVLPARRARRNGHMRVITHHNSAIGDGIIEHQPIDIAVVVDLFVVSNFFAQFAIFCQCLW